MNLYFTGHGEKYAVEQTLLTLFPRSGRCTPTRPLGGTMNWSCPSPGEDLVHRPGHPPPGRRTYTRQCRVQTSQLSQDDPVVATRLTRRTLQRAFYLAAVDCLGAEPPRGGCSPGCAR